MINSICAVDYGTCCCDRGRAGLTVSDMGAANISVEERVTSSTVASEGCFELFDRGEESDPSLILPSKLEING